MLFAGTALKGYAIRATDGKIGTVNDLLFDDTSWLIRWVVDDTGAWLPGRKVLLHPAAITATHHAHQALSVALTTAQVRASPDILQDQPVSLRMQNSLYDHYGWDPLWGGGYYGGVMSAPLGAAPVVGAPGPDADADPHLRSITAVTGYHIHASDGDIGHIETILIDDATWHIRYLVVDTKNWWAGRQVLIAPEAVQDIDWLERRVRLNITRAQIEASPPWDPAKQIDHAYEAGLYRHYGWTGRDW
jgi:hypothetical protein